MLPASQPDQIAPGQSQPDPVAQSQGRFHPQTRDRGQRRPLHPRRHHGPGRRRPALLPAEPRLLVKGGAEHPCAWLLPARHRPVGFRKVIKLWGGKRPSGCPDGSRVPFVANLTDAPTLASTSPGPPHRPRSRRDLALENLVLRHQLHVVPAHQPQPWPPKSRSSPLGLGSPALAKGLAPTPACSPALKPSSGGIAKDGGGTGVGSRAPDSAASTQPRG